MQVPKLHLWRFSQEAQPAVLGKCSVSFSRVDLAFSNSLSGQISHIILFYFFFQACRAAEKCCQVWEGRQEIAQCSVWSATSCTEGRCLWTVLEWSCGEWAIEGEIRTCEVCFNIHCYFPCYPSVSWPRGFDFHLPACSSTLPQHFLCLPLCVNLLLCFSLRECSLFPLSYMCYRLLGNALPLLSMEQLQLVLKGKVMLHYGEHVVAAQVGLWTS